jgi:phospholipase/carboxylesterase
MTYSIKESDTAVVLSPNAPVQCSVIWLHGLGADGYDFVPITEELDLPSTMGARFVFPHARQRPVTVNNGFVMRAWYDIRGFGLTSAEDEAGVRESDALVRKLIEQEIKAGVAARSIVLAGFSQGGAMALYSGLRYPERLGGIIGLSTYLPLRDSLPKEAATANRDVPILMCHGTRDQVVAEIAGQLSRDLLTGLGYIVEWRSYAMEHQVCPEEVAEIARWLKARLSGTST